VLKKVWDDNGLTSSNSNLNQYLSMLRKTFRHYEIDNIIVTVSRGLLQLNPEITVHPLDAPAPPEPQVEPPQSSPSGEPDAESPATRQSPIPTRHARGTCWYIAGVCLLTIALLLVLFSFFGSSESRPITLTQ
ncbi:winged helix family transcriptional regulator, partial [Bacillus sp. SRB_28]